MNEYLMRAYLKSRKRDMSDSDFIRKMKEYFGSEKYERGIRRNSMEDFAEDRMYDDFRINRHSDMQLSDIMDKLNPDDKDRLFRMMLEEEGETGNHFSESSARYLVSQMYHISGGRKFTGEKYDMSKAKEICERYRGIIPTSITAADVYVAINSQYHNYAELFKSWFGDNIEQKIIESAVKFWFKDNNCKAENKVVEYLREY